MRKKNENLRDILLGYACDLASTSGLETVNIRTIAQKAGIASGTVYHYFNSKEDIMLALTEEYWREVLRTMPSVITAATFPEQLVQIYSFLRAAIENAAGKLRESLANTKGPGLGRIRSL